MPAHQHISIVSVNMRKCNAVTHALLNSEKNTHLLFIQEPWFDKIGTARSDNARQGVDIRGRAASPEWELIYPGLTEGQRLKVMTYAHKTQHETEIPHTSLSYHGSTYAHTQPSKSWI